MTLFVFGLGYTALRFVTQFRDHFSDIAGTVRSADKARAIGNGIDVFRFDGTQADPAMLARAQAADRLLISVPPVAGRDPVLTALPQLLANARADRIVYLSTIGVYADHAGNWIDESATLIDGNDRRGARARVERDWESAAGARLRILRLAGIYGPDRNAFDRLANGTARRIVKPGQVMNRIHVDDAAAAIAAAFDHTEGGVWNVCDNEPAPPQDVIAYAAQLLGRPAPPDEDFATAEMTPMARSFYATSNRVRNTRLRDELGVHLAYPTYREGLAALRPR